jgi:hypothetical protein
MPSISSLVLTFTQATHLPIAMLWCTFRAFSCYGLSENVLTGLTFNVLSFLTPSIKYRSQLTGGWFREPDAQEIARNLPGRRAVPLHEQLRNVGIIVLYAEFMTTVSYWIYRGVIPATAITWPHSNMAVAMLTAMQTIDRFTPEFIYSYSLLRLGLFTAIGYFGLYGGLATLLGDGIVEVKKFIANWYASAEALDIAKWKKPE